MGDVIIFSFMLNSHHTANTFSFGTNTINAPNGFAAGYDNNVSNTYSSTFGVMNTCSGPASLAEGYYTTNSG